MAGVEIPKVMMCVYKRVFGRVHSYLEPGLAIRLHSKYILPDLRLHEKRKAFLADNKSYLGEVSYVFKLDPGSHGAATRAL